MICLTIGMVAIIVPTTMLTDGAPTMAKAKKVIGTCTPDWYKAYPLDTIKAYTDLALKEGFDYRHIFVLHVLAQTAWIYGNELPEHVIEYSLDIYLRSVRRKREFVERYVQPVLDRCFERLPNGRLRCAFVLEAWHEATALSREQSRKASIKQQKAEEDQLAESAAAQPRDSRGSAGALEEWRFAPAGCAGR